MFNILLWYKGIKTKSNSASHRAALHYPVRYFRKHTLSCFIFLTHCQETLFLKQLQSNLAYLTKYFEGMFLNNCFISSPGLILLSSGLLELISLHGRFSNHCTFFMFLLLTHLHQVIIILQPRLKRVQKWNRIKNVPH